MKTLLKLTLTLVVLLTAASFSQEMSAKSGSKKTVTNTLNVASFHEVEVSSAIEVVYTQSNGGYSASVTLPEKLVEHFKCESDGETLKIWLKGINSYSGKIVVEISAPYISEIECSGASRFTADKINQVNKKLSIDCTGASTVSIKEAYVKKAEIECSGASNVKLLALRADYVDAECSGASSVTLSGESAGAELEASGASSISAQDLAVKKGKAEASGASTVKCNILNLYSKSATGMSSVINK